MIAEEFFNSIGDLDFGESGPSSQLGEEQPEDSSVDDAGDQVVDDSNGYTGDLGGDLGSDWDGGDWSGGDFGGGDW
jgi:hypothetical protein